MCVAEYRRSPAFKGARFDANGFCLAHPDVLLCKPVNNGKYKTIRKICFKCGSASFTNQGRHQKKKLQGYRRKTMPLRFPPSDAATGSGIGAGHRAKKSERRASQDASTADKARATAERRAGQVVPARTRARSGCRRSQDARAPMRQSKGPIHKNDRGRRKDRATSPVRKRNTTRNRPAPTLPAKIPVRGKDDGRNRRGRTLSPLRKRRPKSLVWPSSLDKKKLTDQKIKELMNLMPRQVSRAGSSTRLQNCSGAKDDQNHTSREQSNMPFDENGHCKAHPEVRLAKKSVKNGEWEIVSGVCPRCCASAVIACKQKQSSTADNQTLARSNDGSDEIVGKVYQPRPVPVSPLSISNPNDKYIQNNASRKLTNVTFDENGYCRAHPEVRLAKKSKESGEWQIVSGVCPQCCVSAALACKQQQSSASDTQALSKELNTKKGPTNDSGEVIAEVLTEPSRDSHQTQPASASSSYPATPESASKPAFSTDYFTSANKNIVGLPLDIYRGKKMAADLEELNESCVSENTVKITNASSESVSKSNADLFPKEPPGRRL